MNSDSTSPAEREREAALRLTEATESEKCHACGSMHSVVMMLEDEPAAAVPDGILAQALESARSSHAPPEIDCRGCEPCLSMAALKAARGMEG